MTIVDNNVLSALAKIERLSLLPAVFETVGTPTAVITELDRARSGGYDFASRIDAVKSYNGGWLNVISPTQSELQLTDEIRDHALSMTDAQCLAIASRRDRRLITDDAHVGTIGNQRNVDIWDITLFLRAAIRVGAIANTTELSEVIDDLRRRDGYRFSTDDEESLFDEF